MKHKRYRVNIKKSRLEFRQWLEFFFETFLREVLFVMKKFVKL